MLTLQFHYFLYSYSFFLLILTASYEQESGEDFISLNLKQ